MRKIKIIHEGKVYCCDCKYLGKGGCWKEVYDPRNYKTKKRLLYSFLDNKKGECGYYEKI